MAQLDVGSATLTRNNGSTIPQLGLGVWQTPRGPKLVAIAALVFACAPEGALRQVLPSKAAYDSPAAAIVPFL